MTTQKPRVPRLFAYGFTFLGSATSPGIEWQHAPVLPSTSSGVGFAVAVQVQNEILRDLASPLEKLLCLAPTSGSGFGAIHDRVWIEAAPQLATADIEHSEGLDTSDAVATIRAALSLQVKELAAVLGVERPTIYAWLRDEAKPQPQNRTRIAELLKYAKTWSDLSKRPVGAAVRNELDANGKSLVELLSESSHDRDAIIRRMQSLASSRGDQPKGIHEIARRHGIDLGAVRESQAEFDVLTGKPFHED